MTRCRFDQFKKVLVLTHADGKQEELNPAYVRRNDTSAASINEWTGERIAAGGLVPDSIIPLGLQPVGNYAVLIMWEDGFNQVTFPHQTSNMHCQGLSEACASVGIRPPSSKDSIRVLLSASSSVWQIQGKAILLLSSLIHCRWLPLITS